ncbi:homeobox protein Hox-D9-like [Vulpes lagopus]|uniref:homeobox protein Hox-D9-like n=1 Tax=Vulpes lagopus TaxID=494514 RepID=UPI001BC97BD2|nr:homeobox protein Hox-D9-like [Vulpes lagopus]
MSGHLPMHQAPHSEKSILGGAGPPGRGPGLAAKGRRGSGYCTFPPGPARSVPTRATERACAASCRAASTPGPAAAASSATEPAVTQAANTALKGGGGGGGNGGGGGGCASALPVPRDPPSDQRRPGEAKKGAAPCWYSLFLSVGQGLLAAGTLMHSSFCCIERTTEAKEGV